LLRPTAYCFVRFQHFQQALIRWLGQAKSNRVLDNVQNQLNTSRNSFDNPGCHLRTQRLKSLGAKVAICLDNQLGGLNVLSSCPATQTFSRLRLERQASLQYLTSFQTRAHFLRHVNGRPQTTQIF
jgi:hypothetical protein